MVIWMFDTCLIDFILVSYRESAAVEKCSRAARVSFEFEVWVQANAISFLLWCVDFYCERYACDGSKHRSTCHLTAARHTKRNVRAHKGHSVQRDAIPPTLRSFIAVINWPLEQCVTADPRLWLWCAICCCSVAALLKMRETPKWRRHWYTIQASFRFVFFFKVTKTQWPAHWQTI